MPESHRELAAELRVDLNKPDSRDLLRHTVSPELVVQPSSLENHNSLLPSLIVTVAFLRCPCGKHIIRVHCPPLQVAP